MRKLCEWKSVRILEAECCADHIHMLVEIPPKMSVSGFMGYLKGKSSLMLYEQFGNLKFKYRNREFWCRGYYVDTVGKNTAKIQDYIKHQLEEDKMGEQLGVLEILCHSSNIQSKRNDTCPTPSISTKCLRHLSPVRH